MVKLNEEFDPRELNEGKQSVAERTLSTNKEGGRSYDPDTAKFDLYKQVLNNLLEDTYYQEAEEQLQDVVDAFERVAAEDPEFVLQLATYARQEQGFRDIAQVLLVLSAYDERTQEYVRRYAPNIIDRTDEFNTVVSLALNLIGRNPNKSLKKGIEDALHEKYAIVRVPYSGTSETERVTYIDGAGSSRFESAKREAMDRAVSAVRKRNGVDGGVHGEMLAGSEIVDEGYVHNEYTAAKYLARNKDVSLYDVINLVEPRPRTDNRDALFERIVKGDMDEYSVEPLREETTWESELSEDDDRSDAEKFRERLDDMGIMARVRNLRNMREAGLSGEEIFDYDDGVFGPESERIVRASKQFPFRYYQAYKATAGATRNVGFGRPTIRVGSTDGLLDEHSAEWLEHAIDASVSNLPDSLTNTFTAIDLSGSMNSAISNESSLDRAEIGALFGAILLKHDSHAGVFATDFAPIEADTEANGVLEIAEEIFEVGNAVGGGTDAGQVVEWMRSNDYEYDRVVVLTDMQLWGGRMYGGDLKSEWDRYVSAHSEDPHLYTIDLASYGDLKMPEGYHNVHQISGWDTSVIEYVDSVEQAQYLVSEIGEISPEADY